MDRLIAMTFMEKTMNTIQQKINALEAEKFLMLEKLVDENILKLITEVKNLQTGCGDGYREEDYYAPTRYYSEIKGIKNLRIYRDGEGKTMLTIKVESRIGRDLAEHIKEYNALPKVDEVRITYSKHYSDEIDY